MHYPTASSEDADYFVVNDLVCDDGRTADKTMKKALRLAIKNGEDMARIKCTDRDAYSHALSKLFDTNDGTTEMFALLNETLGKKGDDKVLKYSMIKNDEAFTITVRFENDSPKSSK